MRGGGTQTADFFGFGGGIGRTFGFGRVFGGIFFGAGDSVSSLPLKEVLAVSPELSNGLKKRKIFRRCSNPPNDNPPYDIRYAKYSVSAIGCV